MKRFVYILLPVLIILVSICGSCIFHPLPPFNNPNDPQSNQNANSNEYSVNDLFPHTLGSSWTYNNTKSVIVSDIEVSIYSKKTTFNNADDSGYVEFELSTGGLFARNFSNPDHILVTDGFSHNPILPYSIQVGANWTGEVNSNSYSILFSASIVSSTETVTIAAKSYSDCIYLVVNWSYPEGYNQDPMHTPDKREFFIVKGIGCIKRVDTNLDGFKSFYRLTDYEIKE